MRRTRSRPIVSHENENEDQIPSTDETILLIPTGARSVVLPPLLHRMGVGDAAADKPARSSGSDIDTGRLIAR
jgi:hypothetical protein